MYYFISVSAVTFLGKYVHLELNTFISRALAHLKKRKMYFFQKQNRKVKHVLSWGWCQWDGGKYKERV
jgi:hypothetical protein